MYGIYFLLNFCVSSFFVCLILFNFIGLVILFNIFYN